MAQQFDTNLPPGTPPIAPRRSNALLIAVIVILVILCCCCLLLVLAWNYGDYIVAPIQNYLSPNNLNPYSLFSSPLINSLIH